MKTFKKILCTLLVIVMCLTAAPLQEFVKLELPDWSFKAKADDQESYNNYNGFLYMRSGDNELTVAGYEGNKSTIEIPRTIDGRTVTKVTSARGGAISKSVKKLIIPNTVTVMDVTSDSVEEIVIPDSVITINWIDCKNLKNLKIPDSVRTLGTVTSSKIKSLEIPDSVTSLGLIWECTSLKKITIPAKISKINSFYNCKSLSEICFEGNIDSIRENAFQGCENLKKVEFKQKVKNIGKAAFMYCTKLESINLPEGLEKIEEDTFRGCNRLNNIVLPQSLKSIGKSAFLECFSIKDIDIPKNVTNIGKDAFSFCLSIEKVAIYNKKAVIGTDAFKNEYHITNLNKYLELADKSSKIYAEVNEEVMNRFKDNFNNVSEEEMYAFIEKLYKEKGLYKLTEEAQKLYKKGTSLLIKCYKGSTAEKYAKTNGIKYKYFSNNPDEVTAFKASSISTSAITLSWDKVSDATGYVVYKYDSAKKKYVKLGSTKKITCKISELKKGTSYKFKIKAYKKVNGKNYYSDYTALTTSTKPGTPTLKVTAGTKSAKLTWNKQTGATGYVVYMATSKDGKYSKVATVKGNSKVTYTKKSLKSGKTYYFKVRAYKTVEKTNIYGSYSRVKGVKAK